MNGKGDSPRPLSVGREEYGANWDRVFGRDVYRCHLCGKGEYTGVWHMWGAELICPSCLQRAMTVGTSTHTEEGE